MTIEVKQNEKETKIKEQNEGKGREEGEKENVVTRLLSYYDQWANYGSWVVVDLFK